MGLMSKYVIEVYALSGVVVRANDFRKDLRLVGYSYYSRIEFNVVVGIKGDSMDRYLVRMKRYSLQYNRGFLLHYRSSYLCILSTVGFYFLYLYLSR